jgi:hypothetical protein
VSKITVPVNKLPTPNSNGDHLIRFRIKNKTQNTESEWSNLFIVESLGQIYPLESNYFLQATLDLITISWETPSVYNTSASANTDAIIVHNHGGEWKQHPADIFVSFNNSASSNFVYWGRSSDNQSSIVPQEYIQNYSPELSLEELEDVRVIVQSESRPPKINDKFKFIDTGIVSLNP